MRATAIQMNINKGPTTLISTCNSPGKIADSLGLVTPKLHNTVAEKTLRAKQR
jgi:hypothetical protein